MADDNKKYGGARFGTVTRHNEPPRDDNTDGYHISKIAQRQGPKKEKLHRRIWDLFFGGESGKLGFVPRNAPGVDRTMAILICLLLSVGTVMVFSAGYAYAEYKYHSSFYFIKRQIIWVSVGLIAMFVASRVPSSFYKFISRIAYAVTVFMLLLVPVLGRTRGGARRWLEVGPLTIQPSEIAKMSLVLILAWYFTTYEDRIHRGKRKGDAFIYGTLIPCLFIGLICGLVAIEKHLSGLIIIGLIGVMMMLYGGSQIRYLAMFGAAGGVGVTCLALFTSYTKRRIDIWLNPEAFPRHGGWQTIQGMLAIGSGGLFGLGLGNSRLKYSYVSEPQNDMIFTIACEELGFIGAVAILALFALFVWRGYTIAMKCEDRFSQLTVLGLTSKVAIQVLLNVAVVTNTIPNTGISLPFFSYGGSSLVILLCEMGIILSMSRYSNVKK